MIDKILPSPLYEKEKARLMSPLELAYVGDTVYDLFVRSALLSVGGRLKDLNHQAVLRVNAQAQARALENLLPLLDEEEASIVRRGRNTHAHHHAPKAASTCDYAGATGLEALIGYLYLTGGFDRINDLMHRIWEEDALCRKQD